MHAHRILFKTTTESTYAGVWSVQWQICRRRWRLTSSKTATQKKCRCKVTAVKMQVEINLFKAPTVLKVFQNFLSGRQGGVDWCPRNATLWHEMSMVKIWSEVSMWVCLGSTLSNEMRLNPRKLQWNCNCCPSMVLHSLSRTTCVSIVKSGVKFRILFLDGFS